MWQGRPFLEQCPNFSPMERKASTNIWLYGFALKNNL
jgi:hypothetical protein